MPLLVDLHPTVNGTHANILLFYHVTREIEQFDPVGKVGLDNIVKNYSGTVRRIVKSELEDVLGDKWKFIGIDEVCPYLGPQAIESMDTKYQSGFCVVWSTIYVYVPLLNPYYTSRYIQHHLTKNYTKEQLRSMVEKFAVLMDFVNRVVTNDSKLLTRLGYPSEWIELKDSGDSFQLDFSD